VKSSDFQHLGIFAIEKRFGQLSAIFGQTCLKLLQIVHQRLIAKSRKIFIHRYPYNFASLYKNIKPNCFKFSNWPPKTPQSTNKSETWFARLSSKLSTNVSPWPNYRPITSKAMAQDRAGLKKSYPCVGCFRNNSCWPDTLNNLGDQTIGPTKIMKKLFKSEKINLFGRVVKVEIRSDPNRIRKF